MYITFFMCVYMYMYIYNRFMYNQWGAIARGTLIMLEKSHRC